tara:strand:- start:2537 stop:2920 length:384 start_codon:yes stop_codon:yes gene_type:complete
MKWIELKHDEDNPSRIAEYTENDCGCYFDGAFGFVYNAKRLIDLAHRHGCLFDWKALADVDFTASVINITDDQFDALASKADFAVDWLNENTLRPPFIEGRREYFIHWGWYDGDFGLWKYDEDGEQI